MEDALLYLQLLKYTFLGKHKKYINAGKVWKPNIIFYNAISKHYLNPKSVKHPTEYETCSHSNNQIIYYSY